MKTIRYQGYEATQGTTRVMLFWSDVHDLDFRADKPINSMDDLKDQVERFHADKTQFDVTSYNAHAKSIPAVREYDCIVTRTLEVHTVTFEHNGKSYKTRTTKEFSVIGKIRKNAKITEHYSESVRCEVWDTTGEIVKELNVLNGSRMNRMYALI